MLTCAMPVVVVVVTICRIYCIPTTKASEGKAKKLAKLEAMKVKLAAEELKVSSIKPVKRAIKNAVDIARLKQQSAMLNRKIESMAATLPEMTECVTLPLHFLFNSKGRFMGCSTTTPPRMQRRNVFYQRLLESVPAPTVNLC